MAGEAWASAMRKGRRGALGLAGWLLLGAGVTALAAHNDPMGGAAEGLVRLTVEIDWASLAEPPGAGADAVVVEVSEGRVLGAVARPGSDDEPASEAGAEGTWRIGSGSSGRARVRLEVPVGADLRVRAAGQLIRVPILKILEGPQRTAAQAPVNVGVERVPWDALEVSLPSGADGTAGPGSVGPVGVALNILTPEPTEVMSRIWAELRPIRGQDVLWRTDVRQVVATNAANHPSLSLGVVMPQAEGTYVLEVRSSWEPLGGHESSRLGRWIRRWRGSAGATTSVRRVTLAVIGSAPVAPGTAGHGETVVDSVDLGRPRPHRPTAAGRNPPIEPGHEAWPLPDVVLGEARRLELLRGWMNRGGVEPGSLGPADSKGLAWMATELKVPHPGRPHRLTLTVTGGHPEALGVALVSFAGSGGRPRILLDACASGLPILERGPIGSFSWLVWPDDDQPVLLFLNRGNSPVRLGDVRLTELASVPPPPVLPETIGEGARTLGLFLAGPHALDPFGGATESGLRDSLGMARNLAAYLTCCGATAVVLPDALADRARRLGLDGQAEEDATAPDRLELLLRILERQNLTVWLDVNCQGRLPGLPAPDSAEGLERGLVRVDRRGLADGPAYHPLSLDVQKALKQRLAEAIAPRRKYSALAGVLIRLGSGATLLGSPDSGFDDATFARFVQATGLDSAHDLPGLSQDDPNRFAARQQFLAGPGRVPWLTWRAKELGALYGSLAKTVAEAAPGAVLAVATPGLDEGPVAQEARRGDAAGVPPQEAWRAVGLDLAQWPSGQNSPVVLRGIGLTMDDLGHDLATCPELDAQVATRHRRGVVVGLTTGGPSDGQAGPCLTACPAGEGPAGDEPLEHALGALDARWMFLTTTMVAGQEDRIRRFASLFRAIPYGHDPGPVLTKAPSGVAVRAIECGSKTYLAMANDTPYPIRLETVLTAPADAIVTDLGRGLRLAPESVNGGKRLVLDLAPFGLAAIRVSAPGVRMAQVKPHHPSTVLASLEAKKDDLSRTLTRLNRLSRSGDTGPPSPGFEPNIELTAGHDAPRPNGWHPVGDPGVTAIIDASRPRSGQGSLRVDAPAPGGVSCDAFVPPGGPELMIRAWLRGERSETPVRISLEGDQAGRPFAHQVEVIVQPFWAAVAVPIPNVPPGGLDQARLRFELLVPGRLWVDDVTVTGEGLSEPQRRNARRTLLAALQAYREQRYADFARLAGSHWARQAEPAPRIAASAEADRPGPRGSDASPLPAGRRLR